MSWFLFIVTSIEKFEGYKVAISRIVEWIGLLSVIPHIALGDSIIFALCNCMIVLNPANPGAIILGPPLNPAKK